MRYVFSQWSSAIIQRMDTFVCELQKTTYLRIDESGADARNQTEFGGTMTYIITAPCIDVKDRGCVDVCPVDCIYEGSDQLYIRPDECIDCGACVLECPVEAIFPEEEVPDRWQSFVAKNYEYFESGEEREVAKGRDED